MVKAGACSRPYIYIASRASTFFFCSLERLISDESDSFRGAVNSLPDSAQLQITILL